MQSDDKSVSGEPDTQRRAQAELEESSSRTWFAFKIVLICLAFLLTDVLVPQDFSNSSFVFFILLNIVVAQLTLICVWGTLVEGTFWVRMPWTLLLLVVAWAALVYGMYLEQGQSVDTREVLGLGLIWFFGFAVSYVPLKTAAWFFGWRITQEKSLSPNPNSNRYAIRDMMIGTAILAVVMSIGSYLIQGKELPTWSAVLETSQLGRIESLFVVSVFSVVSLIVKLPCIWVALATTKTNLVSNALCWILLSGLFGLAEFFLLCFVLGPPGSETLETFCAMTIGHMVMAAVMIGVLCVLRHDGYGITRINKRPI